MERPLVKINIDDAQAINELYGIGDDVAQRIVDYRTANGFFKAPDDLAQVKGISLHLAETLSSQIDWESPSLSKQETESSKERINLAFLNLIIIFILLYTFYFLFKKSYLYLGGGSWLDYWLDVSIFSSQLFGIIGQIFHLLSELTADKSKKKKFTVIKYYFWGLILLGSISLGLGNIVMYQEIGWDKFFKNTIAVAAMLVLINLSLFAIAIFVAIRKITLIKNKYFVMFFDIVVLLNGCTSLLAFYVSVNEFPVVYLLLALFFSVIYIYVGIKSLRNNDPLIILFVGHWLDISENNQQKSWLKWLNSRVPSPEDQKELQSALNEAYPPSKLRTIFSILIIGIGGWTILQAIGAVVQWIVGKGLDKIFGDIFNATKP